MTNKGSILNDKESVAIAIEGSISKKEVLNKLGLQASGGNYKSLEKACESHGLPLPAFDYRSAGKNLNRPKEIPNEEVFVQNSTYSNRTLIKKRLLKLGLENRCSECLLTPTWNGKRLTLQLDHINGVADDNRLENLRLLCPNCHSQTETFCGRGAGAKRKSRKSTCSCGNSKSSGAGLCRECNLKWRSNRYGVRWPDDRTLLDDVARLGSSAVSRAIGVSEAAVRKRVRKIGL